MSLGERFKKAMRWAIFSALAPLMRGRASWWDLGYLFGAPWDKGRPPRELVELVEGGRIQPCRALDIGCGTGASVVYLASKGFEASGLDISRVAIQKATKRASERGVDCSFYVLDFLDPEMLSSSGLSTFDLLLDYNCFNSFAPKDRDKYVSFLGLASHSDSLLLLWCFSRRPARRNLSARIWNLSARIQGRGRGIAPDEVERRFRGEYQILEKREPDLAFHRGGFYVMKPAHASAQ